AGVLLLLADRDRAAVEVDVLQSRTKHFTSPGTGVRTEGQHRVHPREVPAVITNQAAVRLHPCQEFLDLGDRQVQAIPQLVLLLLRQVAARDPSLDLLPGLERWLLLFLGVVEVAERQRTLDELLPQRPLVPDGRERAQFLLDGDLTDRVAGAVLLSRSE